MKKFHNSKTISARSRSSHSGRGYGRWALVATVVGLTLFGVLMVYNASVAQAYRDFNDKYYFLKKQVFWLFIGFTAAVFFSFVDYKFLRKFAPHALVVTVLLLLVVFLPSIGTRVKGAHRWISIGSFTLQPAEFAKLSLIVYLSAFFSKHGKSRPDFFRFMAVVAVFVGLIMLEPDLGTTIVLVAVAFVLYFIAGGALKNFLFVLPVGLLLLVGLIFVAPYRLKRLETFFSTLIDPTAIDDPLGSSYHIRQALIGLGSGGFLGVGLGRSRQKYEYLPEATTDSIFAIIGEELGFIGATVVVLALMYVVYQGFKISERAPDRFGQLLGFGLTTFIAVQALVNLGAMVALVPLTGVPLPFISYGGSSLLSVLIAVGILFNISKHEAR